MSRGHKGVLCVRQHCGSALRLEGRVFSMLTVMLVRVRVRVRCFVVTGVRVRVRVRLEG